MAFDSREYRSLDRPAAPFSDPLIIPNFPKDKVPRHVGVIMDGNGRWAKKRGLKRTDGHQAAEPVVFDTIAAAIEAHVRYLSLYTFSTENWNRSPSEVRFLMNFSRDIIHRRIDQMNQWGVRIRWAGRRPRLWKSVIDELERAEKITKNNSVIDVVFCINYGGRAELADAAAAIAKEVRDGKISGDRVTEKMISDHLYNPDIPDVDLVIRTSGEMRTSNFLPWEAAYAELDFVPELFPDCGRQVFWRCINDYLHRHRRFGAVPASGE
jgi:undecaprenyl diphosphate synthase